MWRVGWRWWEPVLGGLVAAAAIAGIGYMQQSQLQQSARWNPDPQQLAQQEAVRLKLLRHTPTFGFDNLLSSWLFLSFIQYYGDTPVRMQTGYELSEPYLDLITQRDPRFIEPYLFVSGVISYQLGEPKRAIQMMERGSKALSPQINPKAFQVWRFQGLDQFLLLGDIPGAIYSHEMAAKWVQGTPYEEYSPLFQQTADFLRKDPNSKLVRFQSWQSVYQQALAVGDRQTQERAVQEIEALGGKVYINAGGELTFEAPPDALRPPVQSSPPAN